MDEPTASVDSNTEAMIQESLSLISAGRTTIVIAHRLSTVVDVDQIVVLSKGEIAERGTHDQLLAKNGEYAKMWRKQQHESTRAPMKPVIEEKI